MRGLGSILLESVQRASVTAQVMGESWASVAFGN